MGYHPPVGFVSSTPSRWVDVKWLARSSQLVPNVEWGKKNAQAGIGV